MPVQPRLSIVTKAIVASAAVGLWAANFAQFNSKASDDDSKPKANPTAPIVPSADGHVNELPIRYDRDIRPILSDRCFKCHGPDPATRQAELRLDQAQSSAEKVDDPAVIVPGSAVESELFSRISSNDDDERMPPPGSNKRPISPAERELIRLWIEQGASYASHWSFIPPQRPALPPVEHPNWCQNEIDRFILARLESEQIAPSRQPRTSCWINSASTRRKPSSR